MTRSSSPTRRPRARWLSSATSTRTRSRTAAERPASSSHGSEQVDAGGDRDRQRHAGVAVVAGEQQDERGDQADADGDEPHDALELGHEGLLSRTAMTAALTPELALAYIRELSADYLGGAVLDARGDRLAGDAALAVDVHGEGANAHGKVFAARTSAHAIVVVTTVRALPGPTRRDIRTALRALSGENAQETPYEPLQAGLVNTLVSAVSAS